MERRAVTKGPLVQRKGESAPDREPVSRSRSLRASPGPLRARRGAPGADQIGPNANGRGLRASETALRATGSGLRARHRDTNRKPIWLARNRISLARKAPAYQSQAGSACARLDFACAQTKLAERPSCVRRRRVRGSGWPWGPALHWLPGWRADARPTPAWIRWMDFLVDFTVGQPSMDCRRPLWRPFTHPGALP